MGAPVMTERSSDSHERSAEQDVAPTELSHTPPSDDFDILHSDVPSSSTPTRRPSLAILVGVVVLTGAAIWFIMGRRSPQPVTSAADAPSPTPAAESAAPLGGAAADVTVPPLDESDSVVRQLVQQLTSHPTITSWLATTGLIRNFTVVVANIADNSTPARHLRGLRPAGTFTTMSSGGRTVIDPATYRRFDGFAAAASSVDAHGAARLYATLKPRIEEAYRDLGHPDTSVDRAIESAIGELLRTPVVEGPIAVSPGAKGIGFVYADPSLEALTPPQKQLLRMGPENMRAIQNALRSVAVALGIPEGRLPQARRMRSS